jgi:hypothetical protein
VKKLLFFITLCLIVIGITPLIAQQNSSSEENGFYCVTVTLERIYPYRKGYIVKYRKGMNKVVDAYLPEEWFHGSANKGEVIRMGSGTDWPHLSVFYKDGEFSHVRLYVRKERNHPSWGDVPLNVNVDDRFENVEDIKLEF